MIAETCHPIDLATFRDARAGGRALPERPVLVTFDDGYRSVFELARPILRRYRIPAADVRLLRAGAPSASVLVRRRDARARAGRLRRDSRAARRSVAASGGRARHAGQRRAGDRADDRGAGAPARRRRVRDRRRIRRLMRRSTRRPRPSSATSSNRADRRSNRGPVGRVDAVAYPFGAPGADYTDGNRRDCGRASASPPASRHGAISRERHEPALERSRFVVLAAVTAAELAHRISLRLAALTAAALADVVPAPHQRPAHVVQPRGLHRGID